MSTLATLPKVLPFYFEATEDNTNGGFPKTFPFDIYFDKKWGIYHQRSSQALKEILDKAYLTGSMLSGGMNDVVVGGKRVDDAYNFIKDNYPLKKGMRVLEIGCGEGQVLQRLAKDGVTCVGLEPGPQVLKIEGENLSIIKDFFPSEDIKGKYDLILHFGVLEHIADPIAFLIEQQKFLTPDGAIICAFPNCEPDLLAGDISLFLHEHYNYFTKDGITRTAPYAKLTVEEVKEGDGGGFLFVKMVASSPNKKGDLHFQSFSDEDFRKKIGSFNQAIKDYFADVEEEEVAVYCPLRAMNVFYIVGISDCRLVDDNKNLRGKFLPAFNRRVESFEEIKKHPPKKLLIYSKTFDEVIKQKCLQAKELRTTEIQAIGDL